jgi:signal transduction histidine kinase
VFGNLIENSLRYGGDRMTTVWFSSQESDSGLTIVCEDDGAGISGEDKKHLFERGFGRNSGLGLFLSREILGITEITITETSTGVSGARFEIAVPKGAYRFPGV